MLGSACGTSEPPPAPPKLEYVGPPATADAALPELTEPPTHGQQCTDMDQCTNGRKGWCLCAEPLPEGGAEAVGFCWDGPIKRGKWWCTVEDGHAVRMGVIFP